MLPANAKERTAAALATGAPLCVSLEAYDLVLNSQSHANMISA
jgi:hypothetical protein